MAASGAIRSRSPLSNARRSLLHLRDRLGEIGIDRIELLDRGETGRLVLHHQRALAHQRRADDAADRRTDRRVIEIELRARDFGLAAADLGLGLALGADGLFVLGLGRRALAGQRRDAARMLAWPDRAQPSPWPARPRSPAVPPRTACGSIRYSGSPAFTSVPWWNRRSTTMPETRGRTSETRVGAIRPGNSRTMARACGRTVKVPTSGSAGAAAAAAAAVGSLQPANSGAIAANIKTMHADRATKSGH